MKALVLRVEVRVGPEPADLSVPAERIAAAGYRVAEEVA